MNYKYYKLVITFFLSIRVIIPTFFSYFCYVDSLLLRTLIMKRFDKLRYVWLYVHLITLVANNSSLMHM